MHRPPGRPPPPLKTTSSDKFTAKYPTATNASCISANAFSGLTSNPLDQIKTDSANTNAPTSGSTPATTQNDELLFGAIFFSGASNSSFTAGTGPCTGSPTGTYTLTNVPLAQGTASGRGLATEYRIATTTGTYAAGGPLTSSTQWAAASATYKVGAATTLTVTKVVDNTGGGTKQIADFPLFVNATSVTSGVQTAFTPGPYTVSETTDPNYTAA